MKAKIAIAAVLLALLVPLAGHSQTPGEWRDTRDLTAHFTVAIDNLDGTPLTDLASVDIFAAQDAVVLGDPNTRILVDTLTNVAPGSEVVRTVTVPGDGPWYFAAIARDQAGNLGALPDFSDVVNVDTVAPGACSKITID